MLDTKGARNRTQESNIQKPVTSRRSQCFFEETSIKHPGEGMRDDLNRHGIFSLNELIKTDLASAKEFYEELFGWTFTETKTINGNPYLVIHREGNMVGGMMLKDGNVPDDVKSYWDPYITVDDVEGSSKRVEELGGEVILPPTDIPKVGRFCVIKDPQGISLNLIMYEDNE
jgi:predicted enzyme related to lactoylglutathione lyase